MTTSDRGSGIFEHARAVADAVLYEGYLLYPYRRSSAKNQVRWQFGVLAPRDWIDAQAIPDAGVSGSAESWFQQAECLLEARDDAQLSVCVRFLQQQRKQVFARGADSALEPVDSLEAATGAVLSFDEARPHEFTTHVPIAELRAHERTVPISVPERRETEPVLGADGARIGEVVRSARMLTALLHVSAQPATAPFPLLRVRVRLESSMPAGDPDRSRAEAMAESMIASHCLLAAVRGRFVSMLDTPAWAAQAAAECHNRHVFPVLAGDESRHDLVLCAPIILPDHPKVAPESPGDLHDATEIDEILSLRTMTLTDAEKREARATDPRAAAIIDRVDSMPAEMLSKLHGAVRSLRPITTRAADQQDDEQPDDPQWWECGADDGLDPHTDTVEVAGTPVARGSRVRLRPRRHGTDAYDMFLSGRTAQVQAVLRDVDGSRYVAVTVEDDPGADLHAWHGRHLQFAADEVEPV